MMTSNKAFLEGTSRISKKIDAINQNPDTDSALKKGIKLIHGADYIYYGEINQSYQKQGFGVLQTMDFQTYFGYFHNNKAEGIGMVIYPSGTVTYGHFLKDTLNGICLVDDGNVLMMGVFDGCDVSGIGFEHRYDKNIWRMIKFNKSIHVAYLREEILPISEGLPSMLALQHSLHEHLTAYLSNNFFTERIEPHRISLKSKNLAIEDKNLTKRGPSLKTSMNFQDLLASPGNQKVEIDSKQLQKSNKYKSLNNLLIHVLEDNDLFIGLLDDKGKHGIGCLINKKDKCLKETGFYQFGALKGYAFTSFCINSYLIGSYVEGLKEGYFIENLPTTVNLSKYSQGQYIGSANLTYEQIKKRQKVYNFTCKDFLSSNYTIKILQIKDIFNRAQPVQQKRLTKQPVQSKVQNSTQQLNQKNQNNILSVKKSRILEKKKISHTYIRGSNEQISEIVEKSSLQIMKEKLKSLNFQSAKKSIRQNYGSAKKVGNSNQKFARNDEDEIAIEENPFDSVVRGIIRINESPKKGR